MKRRLLLMLIGVGAFLGAVAQTTPLSMKECVDIALQNNLRVRRGIYNVQSFNISVTQAKMAFLPTVNAGGSYGLNYGRALNPVTNSYINRNSNTLNGQLTGSWVLFNGLRIQNTFRQSTRDSEASNEDLQKAKNDVIVNVVTLYINVIFNKELLENANYQLVSSQQQLDRIKRQVDAGALSKSNELNQEAQVATNEVNKINQENALNLSVLQLKQAMQLPASTPLEVVIPEIAIEDLVLDQTPDDVYKTALMTMPEIRSALLKVESAEYALKASKGNLYPRLNFNASAQSNYSSASDQARFALDPNGGFTINTNQVIGFASVSPTPDLTNSAPVYQIQPNVIQTSEKYGRSAQLKDNLFKTMSFTLQVPIFNGLQSRTAVQRAAINNELAKITVTETENTLRQTIESSYNDALAASRTYSSSLKQVSAREEAYRMNKQRFDLGSLSYVEYRISENDLFQSKSDLTRAKYNFIFRKKILDFYQGKQIDY